MEKHVLGLAKACFCTREIIKTFWRTRSSREKHWEAEEKTSAYGSSERLKFDKEKITISQFDCIGQRLNNPRNSFFGSIWPYETPKRNGAIRVKPYKGELRGLPRRLSETHFVKAWLWVKLKTYSQSIRTNKKKYKQRREGFFTKCNKACMKPKKRQWFWIRRRLFTFTGTFSIFERYYVTYSKLKYAI